MLLNDCRHIFTKRKRVMSIFLFIYIFFFLVSMWTPVNAAKPNKADARTIVTTSNGRYKIYQNKTGAIITVEDLWEKTSEGEMGHEYKNVADEYSDRSSYDREKFFEEVCKYNEDGNVFKYNGKALGTQTGALGQGYTDSNGNTVFCTPECQEYIKQIYDYANNSSGGGLSVGNDFGFEDVKDNLKLDATDGTIFSNFYMICKNVYRYFTSTVGYLLVIIYWLMTLMDEATTERFSPESFLKLLMKLMISLYIINIFPTLFEQLLGAYNLAIDNIENLMKGHLPDSSGSGNDTLNNYINAYSKITAKDIVEHPVRNSKLYTELSNAVKHNQKGAGYFDGRIATVFYASGDAEVSNGTFNRFITSLISPVVAISTWIVCVSRMIRIPLYYTIAPIGIAGVMKDGTRGPGFRYIRKLLSGLLQGALIMLCLGAYNLLDSGINAEGFGLLAPFAGMLAMLAIIKSTDDMADRMLDAR